MDYHLENRILLSEEPEHKSLYSWSLQEFNKDGKKVGADQIPWWWTVYFTASELCYNYSIETIKKNEGSTEESEIITATLSPGLCGEEKSIENNVLYSMFGTNRAINEFSLRIKKVKGASENETCQIWGCVSYTSEVDFRDITENDMIEIYFHLAPKNFEKIAELIKSRRVDILQLYLSNVSGFYSEWSPSISTSNIKVLAGQEEQVIIKEKGCKIDPPRLGDVGEFNLRVIQRHKLNLKSIDSDNLFEESDDYGENFIEQNKHQKSQLDKDSLMLAQLARNETALAKLLTPVWLILVILCILLIKYIL